MLSVVILQVRLDFVSFQLDINEPYENFNIVLKGKLNNGYKNQNIYKKRIEI